jgi:hypothetical protein
MRVSLVKAGGGKHRQHQHQQNFARHIRSPFHHKSLSGNTFKYASRLTGTLNKKIPFDIISIIMEI